MSKLRAKAPRSDPRSRDCRPRRGRRRLRPLLEEGHDHARSPTAPRGAASIMVMADGGPVKAQTVITEAHGEQGRGADAERRQDLRRHDADGRRVQERRSAREPDHLRHRVRGQRQGPRRHRAPLGRQHDEPLQLQARRRGTPATDWFWQNIKIDSHEVFLGKVAEKGGLAAITVPMMGWVAKDTTQRVVPGLGLRPAGEDRPRSPRLRQRQEARRQDAHPAEGADAHQRRRHAGRRRRLRHAGARLREEARQEARLRVDPRQRARPLVDHASRRAPHAAHVRRAAREDDRVRNRHSQGRSRRHHRRPHVVRMVGVLLQHEGSRRGHAGQDGSQGARRPAAPRLVPAEARRAREEDGRAHPRRARRAHLPAGATTSRAPTARAATAAARRIARPTTCASAPRARSGIASTSTSRGSRRPSTSSRE